MGSSIILISPEHGTQAQRKVKTLGVISGPKILIAATILPVLLVIILNTKLTSKPTFCTALLLVFCPAITKDQKIQKVRSTVPRTTDTRRLNP